jgi:hypothetical protein
MQITINLNEDDVRICKSIVAEQTHFVINSTCIEDAVISGILTQISKKNIAIAKAKKHFSKEDYSKEAYDNERQMREHEDRWSTQEFINDLYDNDSPIGDSI